jgi:hypothetical protein
LSCRVIVNKDLNQGMILQPNLINNLFEKFCDQFLGNRMYRTPGTPRLKVVQPDKDSELNDAELKSRYCSGVNRNLCLI